MTRSTCCGAKSRRDFSAEIDASRRHERTREQVEETLAFIVNDFRAAWFKFEILTAVESSLYVSSSSRAVEPARKMQWGILSRLQAGAAWGGRMLPARQLLRIRRTAHDPCSCKSVGHGWVLSGDRGAKVLLLPNLAFVTTFFSRATEQSSGASAGSTGSYRG